MAKRSGLGMNLYIGGIAVSDDIGGISQISSPRPVQDVTPINKSAMARLLLAKDGAIALSPVFWNPELAHEVFGSLPEEDTAATLLLGETAGSTACSMVAKQLNYDGNRDQSGAFTFATNLQANGYGLEWGNMHTAGIRTDTAATNGSSLDGGAETAFGLQAYLHVFAFTGTSVTVKLQGSSDDGDSDAFTDITGASFTAATDVGWQRIQTARDATIERYTRVVTTGTFTDAQFAVMIVRNEAEVKF